MSEPGRERLLTYADYAALPDDGKRYQLLDGELVMTPSPNAWHQDVLLTLAQELVAHARDHEPGRIYVAPLDVVLDDHNVLQPDIFFISNERAAVRQGGRILGAPDLCVEVLSPGTQHLDRARKREIYARFGVAHCWIVDLHTRAIEEYVLAGGAHRARSVAGYADPFRPAAFPGFVFTLNAVPLPEEPESERQ
jgi:Uma2 family endonuclease